MTTITWLHLTDLHTGIDGRTRPTLWNQLSERLEHDLRESLQRRQIPPIDLVLFTGDLTQGGASDEFGELQRRLDRLWRLFHDHRCDPLLLAVPGNHDLVRPDQHSPEAIAFRHWGDESELREHWFWDPVKGQRFREHLLRMFGNFLAWREACPFVPKELEAGGIPGDSAFTFEKDGVRLGIVGLNTAFLHVDDRPNADDQRLLALEPQQLPVLGDGSFHDWIEEHHACILMTHHQPTWLSEQARQTYELEIYVPDWFDAHLCGHMHRASRETVAKACGGKRRYCLGTSLFGERTFDEKGQAVARKHGYGIGVLEVDKERKTVTLKERLRRAEVDDNNQMQLVLDSKALRHEEETGFSRSEQLDWWQPKARSGPR